jgi:serine O-acetyltransferase
MSLITLLKHDLKIACHYKVVSFTILNASKCAINPRFLPIIIYRISYELNKFILCRALAWFLTLLNRLFYAIDIPPKIQIGGGLFFPHPQNIIIGASSIGEEVVIYHNVTLGAKFLDFNASADTRPTIGNNVIIACNSTILGGYHVKNDAKILPHTLLRGER